MRSAVVAMLFVAFFGNADTIALKTIELHFKNYTETITLSEENITKTCVLSSAGNPYAKTYGNIIAHRNISWQISVLGKHKNDAIAFIAIAIAVTKDSITAINLSLIWNEEKWQSDKTTDQKQTAEFAKKIFTDEEFSKLLDCTFNEQKIDPRQQIFTPLNTYGGVFFYQNPPAPTRTMPKIRSAA